MPITADPEWLRLALYAVAGAVVIAVLMRAPGLGRFIRALVSVGLLALAIVLLMQQAPYQPLIAQMMDRLGLDSQKVVGSEVRIRASPDGHFWANVTINGVERRMLIDSGATVTALSAGTAQRASVEPDSSLVPVIMQTANGAVRARTGSIEDLRVGSIEARDLKVVISPALGNFDVLGMNFLSQLASWRVEKGTLVMVPDKDGDTTGG